MVLPPARIAPDFWGEAEAVTRAASARDCEPAGRARRGLCSAVGTVRVQSARVLPLALRRQKWRKGTAELEKTTMKNLIVAVCVIALIIASARAEDLRTIDGQIFVRTQGAETIKLSLVEIQLFDLKAIADDVEMKRMAAEPIYEALQPFVKEAEQLEKEAKEAMDRGSNGVETWSKAIGDSLKIRGMAAYPHTGLYYFSHLPNSLQTTKTDADGTFTFKVPNGSYVLAAASSRRAGNETEFYYWMIRVIVDADKKVMLANDNLTTTRARDSMISTTETDALTVSAMIGKSLVSLEAFIESKKAVQSLAKERQQKELREQELPIYRRNPKAAQQKAVALYPDVGVAGSTLNNEFVARLKRYRAEKAEFFAEPDWPIRLAKECADELAAKPPAK